MSQMTIEDLRAVLVAAAGEDDSLVLGPDTLDLSFEDLGYDSLALMETAAQIGRRFGVVISDEQIVELHTPREVLDLVNRLAAVAA